MALPPELVGLGGGGRFGTSARGGGGAGCSLDSHARDISLGLTLVLVSSFCGLSSFWMMLVSAVLMITPMCWDRVSVVACLPFCGPTLPRALSTSCCSVKSVFWTLWPVRMASADAIQSWLGISPWVPEICGEMAGCGGNLNFKWLLVGIWCPCLLCCRDR